MPHRIKKYANLLESFPKINPVLAEAIQNETLEIRKIKCSGCKYEMGCVINDKLKKASYVIFSPHTQRHLHDHEAFIFIDAHGEHLCHVSGRDMSLYGMLEPCGILHYTEDYEVLKHCSSRP